MHSLPAGCLPGCVDPALGLHHRKCPNFKKAAAEVAHPVRGRSPRAEASACVNVVLVIGPPASGKSTLGTRLAERFGFTLFDVGAHVRARKPSEEELESFVADSVENLLRESQTKGSGIIFVGYPKYPEGLDRLLKKEWIKIRLTISLEAGDDRLLQERAIVRYSSGERPEDDPTHFQGRLNIFKDITLKLTSQLMKACSVCTIDASLSREEVEKTAAEAWELWVDAAITSDLKKPSHKRQDPAEEDLEVSICLLSGEERLRTLIPPRSTAAALRKALEEDGDTDFNFKFFFNGQEVRETDTICDLKDIKSCAMINVVKTEKPKPPPPPPEREPTFREIAGPGYYARRERGVCFTADCMAWTFRNQVEIQVPFPELQVGDMVHTGKGNGMKAYRRIQRVWAHQWRNEIQTFSLAPGCRLTPGHPVRKRGRWIKPEDVQSGITSFEEVVYQLEVEGHVDTVLVDGIVCALLGCYCGPDFGWNVFTRKTVHCDKQPCSKCKKAVMADLSFHHEDLTEEMLPPASFEPY